MKKLTLKQLKHLKPGIFAKGTFIDNPEDINVANTGLETRWVAVRGSIHDWCIYTQNPHYINDRSPSVIAVGYSGVWDWEKIAREGDKVNFENHIKKLVPCTDEAFKMYRY
jgi:hypothetical protein